MPNGYPNSESSKKSRPSLPFSVLERKVKVKDVCCPLPVARGPLIVRMAMERTEFSDREEIVCGRLVGRVVC